MKRKSRYDDPYSRPPSTAPKNSSSRSLPSWLSYTSIALFGSIFVLGVLVGIGFSSTATFTPENVASREAIDRSAPNAELCIQYGASAIVSDMRVFITLNPFNVYVTQPKMRPGCVLRQNNWSILEQKGLVNSEQVRDCKNRMNTFGFTGPLEGSPTINCIYQNDGAGNLFINPNGNPSGNAPPETSNF
jgi:hypothetical protein